MAEKVKFYCMELTIVLFSSAFYCTVVLSSERFLKAHFTKKVRNVSFIVKIP